MLRKSGAACSFCVLRRLQRNGEQNGVIRFDLVCHSYRRVQCDGQAEGNPNLFTKNASTSRTEYFTRIRRIFFLRA